MGADQAREGEIETLQQGRPPRAAASFRLLVVAGPDLNTVYKVDPDASPAYVGQAGSCAIRLRDPRVSRRHLRIAAEDGALRVTDLGSTNGTLVNDVSVIEARLHGGEVVRLGGSALRVERGPDRPQRTDVRARLGRMLGASEAMQPVLAAIERASMTSQCALIEGEPGTGKALASQLVHDLGPRARGPFIVLRAVQAPTSVEGWEALVGDARGGTLVLDEVTELPEPAQASLSTVLGEPGALDARLVATTTSSLDHRVEGAAFDADLADRLSELRIELPPLRSRKGDVELLAAHFWSAFGAGSRPLPLAATARFAARPWPGNVTELQREVARELARALDEASAGAQTLEDPRDYDLPYSRARQRVLDRFERIYVERKLARCSGNVSRAAEESGIARRYFQIVKSRHHI